MLDIMQNPVVFVFGWLTVSCVALTIGDYLYKIRKEELAAALKHDMLERGFSPDDIVKVLEAGKGKPRKHKASECEPAPAETASS